MVVGIGEAGSKIPLPHPHASRLYPKGKHQDLGPGMESSPSLENSLGEATGNVCACPKAGDSLQSVAEAQLTTESGGGG